MLPPAADKLCILFVKNFDAPTTSLSDYLPVRRRLFSAPFTTHPCSRSCRLHSKMAKRPNSMQATVFMSKAHRAHRPAEFRRTLSHLASPHKHSYASPSGPDDASAVGAGAQVLQSIGGDEASVWGHHAQSGGSESGQGWGHRVGDDA